MHQFEGFHNAEIEELKRKAQTTVDILENIPFPCKIDFGEWTGNIELHMIYPRPSVFTIKAQFLGKQKTVITSGQQKAKI